MFDTIRFFVKELLCLAIIVELISFVVLPRGLRIVCRKAIYCLIKNMCKTTKKVTLKTYNKVQPYAKKRVNNYLKKKQEQKQAMLSKNVIILKNYTNNKKKACGSR